MLAESRQSDLLMKLMFALAFAVSVTDVPRL